jgi:hypothetical protein
LFLKTRLKNSTPAKGGKGGPRKRGKRKRKEKEIQRGFVLENSAESSTYSSNKSGSHLSSAFPFAARIFFLE